MWPGRVWEAAVPLFAAAALFDANLVGDIIEGLTKIGTDLWKFDARIQYGGRDYRASVNVPVKWAGETPVLSMTQYAIPGQGVFSARILIHNGMYSGTWGSQAQGGRMFGIKGPIHSPTQPAMHPARPERRASLSLSVPEITETFAPAVLL